MKALAYFVVSVVLSGIWTIAAVAEGTVVLKDAFFPSWSPDGSELVCSRPTDGSYGDEDIRLWRVAASGQNPTLL